MSLWRERGIRRRESDSIVARSESNGSNGRGETGVKSDGKIKHWHRSHVSSFPTRDTFTGTICLIIVMEWLGCQTSPTVTRAVVGVATAGPCGHHVSCDHAPPTLPQSISYKAYSYHAHKNIEIFKENSKLKWHRFVLISFSEKVIPQLLEQCTVIGKQIAL